LKQFQEAKNALRSFSEVGLARNGVNARSSYPPIPCTTHTLFVLKLIQINFTTAAPQISKNVSKSITLEEIHLHAHFVNGLWFDTEASHPNKPLRNSRNTSRLHLEKHLPVNDYCESLHSRCDKKVSGLGWWRLRVGPRTP